MAPSLTGVLKPDHSSRQTTVFRDGALQAQPHRLKGLLARNIFRRLHVCRHDWPDPVSFCPELILRWSSSMPHTYVLGHTSTELERLDYQASLLRPITHRLLIDAGIKRGMRILDVGCGTGASALLAAELVGQDGEVIGIDRSEIAIEAANGAARKSAYRNLAFQMSDLEAFRDDRKFDMVIGRYVMIHQSEPVGFLRQAAHLVRDGGRMAFHEMDLAEQVLSSPTVAQWDAVVKDLLSRVQRKFLGPFVGRHLVSAFVDAGLPIPQMAGYVLMGGATCGVPKLVIDTLRTMSGGSENTTLADGTEIVFSQKLDELIDMIREARAQVSWPTQVCVWVEKTP
jgi:2-polyprenyl-3-methyl-5-hydroxy-6-metoxy-1,4-benzoquinol methylase